MQKKRINLGVELAKEISTIYSKDKSYTHHILRTSNFNTDQTIKYVFQGQNSYKENKS